MPQIKLYNILVLNGINDDSAFLSVINHNPTPIYKYKVVSLRNTNPESINYSYKVELYSENASCALTGYLFSQTYSGIIIIIDKLCNSNIYQIESLLNMIGKKPILIVIETDKCTSENISYCNEFVKSFGTYIQLLFIDTSKMETAYNIHNIITSELIKFTDIMNEKHRLLNADSRGFASSRDYPEWLLVENFINLTLPDSLLDHYNKLRLTYYAILKYGIIQTLNYDSWVFTKFRENDKKDEWNYTSSRFYCLYIWSLLKKYNYNNISFETLVEKHPELEDNDLIYYYYNKKDLDNQHSKKNWIEPTLCKLSVYVPGLESDNSSQNTSSFGCTIL